MFGLIFAIPQEYKKQLKKTGVHQEHLTEPWENLEVLTTEVIHKSFVKYIFEEPATKQRLIADGLTPHQINRQMVQLSLFHHCRNKVTVTVTMLHYKILHDIVFTECNLFKGNLATSNLCYLCLKPTHLKCMLFSCPVVSKF